MLVWRETCNLCIAVLHQPEKRPVRYHRNVAVQQVWIGPRKLPVHERAVTLRLHASRLTRKLTVMARSLSSCLEYRSYPSTPEELSMKKRKHAYSIGVISCFLPLRTQAFRLPVVDRARAGPRAPPAGVYCTHCRRSPHRRHVVPLHASAETKDFDGWEAGDVNGDLERLERAIKIHQAQENLKRSQMHFAVTHLYQEDRPLFPDLIKHVFGPLMVSLLLAVTCKASLSVHRLYRVLLVVYDVHFWVAVIAAPLLFYCARKRVERTRSKAFLHRHSLKAIPNILRWTGYSDDPRQSTDDTSLCLSEQVSSAVLGPALAMAFIPPHRRPVIHILTRLAALVAWHQYPDTLFALTRDDQARPLTLAAHATRQLRRWQGTTTWYLVPALARLLIPWSYRSIVQLFLWISAAYVAVRLNPRLLSCETKALPCCLAILGVGYACVTLLSRFDQGTLSIAVKYLSRGRLTYFRPPGLEAAWMVAVLPSLIHLFAFRNILYVDNQTDALRLQDVLKTDICFPLPDSELSGEVVTEPDTRAIWRWGLEWRDPRRIAETLNQFIENLLGENKFDVKRRRENEAHWETLTSMGASAPELDPPNTWVARAMEQVNEKHAEDYAIGNFEDPLGIAVHRTFGIGLRFNFDHMMPVKRGKRISMRRLQARAVKSAIRRAIEVNDHDKAGASLSHEDFQRNADQEIMYLAKRLSELIPPASAFDDEDNVDDTSRITQLRKKMRHNKSASVENLLRSDD